MGKFGEVGKVEAPSLIFRDLKYQFILYINIFINEIFTLSLCIYYNLESSVQKGEFKCKIEAPSSENRAHLCFLS